MQHSHDLTAPAQAALARLHLVALPTLFKLTYDRTKIKCSPALKAEYAANLTIWGIDFPQGDFPRLISLQNGLCFDDMDELHHHFAQVGTYTIEEVH